MRGNARTRLDYIAACSSSMIASRKVVESAKSRLTSVMIVIELIILKVGYVAAYSCAILRTTLKEFEKCQQTGDGATGNQEVHETQQCPSSAESK